MEGRLRVNMNRESYPPEIEQKIKLTALTNEYISLKNTVLELQARKNIIKANEAELKAQSIATEIIKLDPDFVKNLDANIKETFEVEADALNFQQNEKPTFKGMN